MNSVQLTFGVVMTIITTGNSLKCYICGQSDLPPPGDCPTHFQYDCRHYAQRFETDESIRCRTLRRRTDNDTYTTLKECIADSEHQLTYPSSITNGCEVLFEGTEYEISYCLCGSDYCNEQTIDGQLTTFDSKIRSPQAVGRLPISGAESMSLSVAAPVIQQPLQSSSIDSAAESVQRAAGGYFAPPLQPQSDDTVIAGLAPQAVASGPVADFTSVDFDYYGPGGSNRNNVAGVIDAPVQTKQSQSAVDDPVDLTNDERDLHFQEQATSSVMKGSLIRKLMGLVCTVCGEGNLNRTSPECSKQYAVDCAAQYPSGSQVFCFTRHTMLTNGMSAIEKLCVTDSALIQEYGETVLMDGCASAWQDQVEYCVCNTTMCNEKPIMRQLNINVVPEVAQTQLQFVTEQQETTVNIPNPKTTVAAPPKMAPPQRNITAGNLKPPSQPTNFCFVCGESDLQYPADCGLAYEYDCARQYPDRLDVLCLTRLSKMSNDLFTIEKRCITPEEHRKQYPGNDVVMNGCGTAWDDYVQYCVCATDYCNNGNITAQQIQHKQPVTYNNVLTEYAPPVSFNQTARDNGLTQNLVSNNVLVSAPISPRPTPPRRQQPISTSTITPAPVTTTTTSAPKRTTVSDTVAPNKEKSEQKQATDASSQTMSSVTFICTLVITFTFQRYFSTV